MDPEVQAFGQVMAILVPSIVVLVATVVVAYRALRGRPAPRQVAPVDDRRLDRLEQSVDAIAVEMERVGESQRFLTKLMAERIAANGDSSDQKRGRVITPH
jgi:hypothetical protein